MWRVGNGASKNVCSDAWLPNSPNRKVLTPRGGMVISKVEDLLDPVMGTWDIQLLTSNFLPIDVCTI
jgi:hypothetical protein